MSAERHELHHLIDELPDDQVAELLTAARQRAQRDPRTSEPFDWFGMIEDGPIDASSPDVIDAVLADGFGR